MLRLLAKSWKLFENFDTLLLDNRMPRSYALNFMQLKFPIICISGVKFVGRGEGEEDK